MVLYQTHIPWVNPAPSAGRSACYVTPSFLPRDRAGAGVRALQKKLQSRTRCHFFETTGHWGAALALAAEQFGIEVVAFIEAESAQVRPEVVDLVEKHSGRVVVVAIPERTKDRLMLSADAAIQATREMLGASYVFGSVYAYFVIPQSIIGIELRCQLRALDREADFVVGSCGGGANLLGVAAPFLKDAFEGLFEETEGHTVALETGYQLAVVCRLAQRERRKTICVNISGRMPWGGIA